MALYHVNNRGDIEQCHQFISCPYGDLDTEHYDSPGEIQAQRDTNPVVASLDLYRRVTLSSSLLDTVQPLVKNERPERSDDFEALRTMTASLAFKLGMLMARNEHHMVVEASEACTVLRVHLTRFRDGYDWDRFLADDFAEALNDLTRLHQALTKMKAELA